MTTPRPKRRPTLDVRRVVPVDFPCGGLTHTCAHVRQRTTTFSDRRGNAVGRCSRTDTTDTAGVVKRMELSRLPRLTPRERGPITEWTKNRIDAAGPRSALHTVTAATTAEFADIRRATNIRRCRGCASSKPLRVKVFAMRTGCRDRQQHFHGKPDVRYLKGREWPSPPPKLPAAGRTDLPAEVGQRDVVGGGQLRVRVSAVSARGSRRRFGLDVGGQASAAEAVQMPRDSPDR
jgi:hypothetical protein